VSISGGLKSRQKRKRDQKEALSEFDKEGGEKKAARKCRGGGETPCCLYWGGREGSEIPQSTVRLERKITVKEGGGRGLVGGGGGSPLRNG